MDVGKNNVGAFIFEDDLLEFEPYNTFQENFLHWFKPYMRSVFTSQTRRNVKDVKLLKIQEKEFNQHNNLNDFRKVINAMGRNGFKGPKAYFNPNIMFYQFLINNNIQKISDIKNNAIKFFILNEIDHYSAAYKKDIFVAIKHFLSFIESNNFISNGDSHYFKLDKNLIKLIKKGKKPIAYLEPETEFFTFLDSLEKIISKKDTKARNRAILKILLITGIRASELTNIKLNDFKELVDTYEIKIIGKGNKTRYVYISKELIKKDIQEITLSTKTEHLFTTRTGSKINERFLNTLVENQLTIAKIPKKEKKGPHLLRHSCATWLHIVANFDIAKLQEYMAHEDISTTKKYVHLNEKIVKSMSDKVSKILGNHLKIAI